MEKKTADEREGREKDIKKRKLCERERQEGRQSIERTEKKEKGEKRERKEKETEKDGGKKLRRCVTS
jgi:hypothetical protein